jgi:hypothetical protein
MYRCVVCLGVVSCEDEGTNLLCEECREVSQALASDLPLYIIGRDEIHCGLYHTPQSEHRKTRILMPFANFLYQTAFRDFLRGIRRIEGKEAAEDCYRCHGTGFILIFKMGVPDSLVCPRCNGFGIEPHAAAGGERR